MTPTAMVVDIVAPRILPSSQSPPGKIGGGEDFDDDESETRLAVKAKRLFTNVHSDSEDILLPVPSST